MALERLARDFPNPATFWGELFYALLLLALAWLVGRAVRAAARRAGQRHGEGAAGRAGADFVADLAQIVIYLVALTLYAHIVPALRHIGTALLASVGVISVVLGIAAQQTLGNLAAGVAILLYRPFRVGDQVQVMAPTGVETGLVESLTLGYTILRTFDNRRIVVPNTLMATQVSINLTAVDPRIAVVISFTIAYDADVERARAILVELASAHPGVEGIMSCPVTELGPSGVVLSLRAWCSTADATYQVRFDLLEQAKKRFEEAGIGVPFPTANVIVRSADAARPPSAS